MSIWRKLAIGGVGALLLAAALFFGLEAADRAYPPPLDRANVVSAEVLDADGQLLRRIAQNGMAGVAQLMNGTLPSEPPPQDAPSRGPAIADAEEPQPAAGRTTLAFRRE